MVENKPIEEIEKTLVDGYINGNMMHLRSIEKHFGKNALKILSLLGQIQDNQKDSRNTPSLVYEFFDTKDLTRKKEIEETLLSQ